MATTPFGTGSSTWLSESGAWEWAFDAWRAEGLTNLLARPHCLIVGAWVQSSRMVQACQLVTVSLAQARQHTYAVRTN
jgi:hypothetical protein